MPVVEQVEHLLGLRVRSRGSGEQLVQERDRVDGAHVLRRGAVHRRDDLRHRPLAARLLLLQLLVQHVDSGRGAIAAERIVRRAEAVRGDVVPVDHGPLHRRVLGVDALDVALGGQEALPLVLTGADRRQARVDALRPDRQEAGAEHGDVLVVDVERVEGLRRQRRGLLERLGRVHLAVRETAVVEQVERILAVARALRCDRDLPAMSRGVANDRSMNRRPELHGVRAQGPGDEVVHLGALALVDVLVIAAAAERLRVLVDDV